MTVLERGYPPRGNSEGVPLALLAESKRLLVGLIDRYREKVFARSIAVFQVPGHVLICPHNETTSGITAAIGVTTQLSLRQSTAFCTGQTGQQSGGVIGSPPPHRSSP